MSKIVVVCVFILLVAVSAAGPAGDGEAAAGSQVREYIVVLHEESGRAAALGAVRALGGEVTHEYRHALRGFAARLPLAAVAAVGSNPHVRSVSESVEFTAAAKPSPPTENPQVLQRSVDRIDGERSSARSGDGRGTTNVNVAVIDSGIDSDHPDLNVAGGVNCLAHGDGFEDIQNHGTLVAGSIGALDNTIGFVGVAPGASLYAVRVIERTGTTTMAKVICGVDWVTSTRTDSDPSNDIAVANMSLGGGVNQPDGDCSAADAAALLLAICGSTNAGVTYVVSAGNEGDPIESYAPARYNEVLAVTAMSDTDGRPGGLGATDLCGLGSADDVAAFFSNYATTAEEAAHTVAAPGVCVPSTYPGGLYGRDSGTSFAAPLVAGAVAVCVASGRCAGLSPAQIIAKFVADAAAANAGKAGGYGFEGDPLRPISGRYYGYLINASMY